MIPSIGVRNGDSLRSLALFILTLASTLNTIPLAWSQTAHPGASQLAETLYTDPERFFRIRPPLGWKADEYTGDPRGKVDFNAPSEPAQIKIIATASPYRDIAALLQDCENASVRARERIGGTSACRKISMFGGPAVEWIILYPDGLKQRNIQFLVGNRVYGASFNARGAAYESNYSLAMNSIETLEPLSVDLSPADLKRLLMATTIRTATLYLKMGRPEWASPYIDEGLKIDPNNRELLDIKKTLLK